MNTEVQTVWIELIRKNSKNILVGGVYREWSDNQDKDADQILDQFQRATRENIPVIILGDMNLDMKQWSKKDFYCKRIADKWKSALSKAGFKWENMGYTFESHGVFNGERKKSALDHIYHTDDKVFTSYRTITNSVSDHFKQILTTIHIKQPKVKMEESHILRRSWKFFNQNDFLIDLA